MENEPLSPLQKDILFERWVDHEQDVRRVAERFARKYNEDIDDTFDLAITCFIEAHKRYVEGHDYKTWICNRIAFNLMDVYRSKMMRNTRLPNSKKDLTFIGTPEPPEEFDKSKLEKFLSRDAKTVLSLILDCPQELLDTIANAGKPETKRAILYSHLKTVHGWKHGRVLEAFREIQTEITGS